jgi:hypothetical protein
MELRIARSLGNRFSARDDGLGLHPGETTKPRQLNVPPLEGGDERGIVNHRYVLRREASRLREIIRHRPELPVEY